MKKKVYTSKISLIKEKYLFVENFLDEGKIFACAKFP